MRAILMLADWAEAIQGKLYIQGGGWTRVTGGNPLTFAIVAQIFVDWEETNKPHNLRISMLTEDGDLVAPEPGSTFEIKSKLEVGRPPGVARGSELDAPLAINVAGLPLAAGRYELRLDINGVATQSTYFTVTN